MMSLFSYHLLVRRYYEELIFIVWPWLIWWILISSWSDFSLFQTTFQFLVEVLKDGNCLTTSFLILKFINTLRKGLMDSENSIILNWFDAFEYGQVNRMAEFDVLN